MQVPIIDVARLELKPGDIVIVRVRDRISAADGERIVETVRGVLQSAGHQNVVMVLPADFEIQVLTARARTDA